MKIHRNPDVIWREKDEYKAQALEDLEKGDDVEGIGTSVLYSGGTMLSLNILGTEVWKLCDGKSVDEMVSELPEQFEVAPEVLREDVNAFINELKEKDFIYYVRDSSLNGIFVSETRRQVRKDLDAVPLSPYSLELIENQRDKTHLLRLIPLFRGGVMKTHMSNVYISKV